MENWIEIHLDVEGFLLPRGFLKASLCHYSLRQCFLNDAPMARLLRSSICIFVCNLSLKLQTFVYPAAYLTFPLGCQWVSLKMTKTVLIFPVHLLLPQCSPSRQMVSHGVAKLKRSFWDRLWLLTGPLASNASMPSGQSTCLLYSIPEHFSSLLPLYSKPLWPLT